MRRYLLYTILLLSATLLKAQDGQSAFQFLQLPVSAHVAGLGGENVSLVEDDITLSFHNPALLSYVNDRTLGFNYMTYMEGTQVASAAFNKELSNRSELALGAQYLNFGSMSRAEADGTLNGDFSAKDMALMLIYSFDFNELWSGGVNGKFIYSNYDEVYSLALGVDLGLNYFDKTSGFSASLVAKNLGGQLKTYDGTTEKLPVNIVAGFTQKLAHAPIRYSITLTDLNHWQASDFYNTSDRSFGQLLLKHFIFGVDLLPTPNTYLSVGYNFLLRSELQSGENRSFDGMSIGAGLQVKRIKVGLSYAKYHVSANSLLLNLSIGL